MLCLSSMVSHTLVLSSAFPTCQTHHRLVRLGDNGEDTLSPAVPVEDLYLDGDNVTGAVHHWQTFVHEQLSHVLDVSLVGSAQSLSLLALQDPHRLQCPCQDHRWQGGGEDKASCKGAHRVHQGGAAGNVTPHTAESFTLNAQRMTL